MASQVIVLLPAWAPSIERLFYLIAPFVLRRHVSLIVALAPGSHGLRFAAYQFGYYGEATDWCFFPIDLSLLLEGAIGERMECAVAG